MGRFMGTGWAEIVGFELETSDGEPCSMETARVQISVWPGTNLALHKWGDMEVSIGATETADFLY
jgi:hypothetical protein